MRILLNRKKRLLMFKRETWKVLNFLLNINKKHMKSLTSFGKKAFVGLSVLTLALGLASAGAASANSGRHGDRGDDDRRGRRFFMEDRGDRRGDRDDRRGDRDDRRGDRGRGEHRGDRDDHRGDRR